MSDSEKPCCTRELMKQNNYTTTTLYYSYKSFLGPQTRFKLTCLRRARPLGERVGSRKRRTWTSICRAPNLFRIWTWNTASTLATVHPTMRPRRRTWDRSNPRTIAHVLSRRCVIRRVLSLDWPSWTTRRTWSWWRKPSHGGPGRGPERGGLHKRSVRLLGCPKPRGLLLHRGSGTWSKGTSITTFLGSQFKALTIQG